MCCIPVSTLERFIQLSMSSTLCWALFERWKSWIKFDLKSVRQRKKNNPHRLHWKYPTPLVQICRPFVASIFRWELGSCKVPIAYFYWHLRGVCGSSCGMFSHICPFHSSFLLVLLAREMLCSVHCQASFHFQLSVAAQQLVRLMRSQLDWRHQCTM